MGGLGGSYGGIVMPPLTRGGTETSPDGDVKLTREAIVTDNDVEKRWRDPATFRAAARYIGIVVLLAAVALGATAVSGSLFAGIMVPGSLFIGGIGALVRTYQVWRGYGAWRIWHAASWVLLGLSMFFLGVPLSVNQ